MTKRRPTASLLRDRSGEWVVEISLPDGARIIARMGETQRIVYSNPQRVPTHLKSRIVPELMAVARTKNLTGATS